MMPASYLAWGAFRRVCRAVAVSLAALALVTCTDNPVEPGRGGIAYVRLQPVFDIFSRVAPLTLDRVRVVVIRPTTDTLANVSQSFSPTSTSVRLDIPVRLERTSEDLEVILELYAGSILLFSGADTARVSAGISNPVSQIPVIYQGPGSNIASITLAPRDTTVFFGAAFDMQASAVDSQQAPVPQFYVGWTATGGTIDASGRFTAPAARDTVFVKAVTPTGIADSTRVFIVASPAALVKVSGDAQNGSIGTRLAQPLVVRVDGSDGRPVPGVLVSFAAVTGGGSVDSATFLSDPQGLATMGATLGLTIGAQTFTASAPGLTPVTFSMTAASSGVRTWTGAVSTDWNTAGNWSPAALPGAGDSVVIPTFIPNAPDLNGNATIGALVLRGTGTNLTVAGNLTVQRGIAIPDTNAFLGMSSGALAAGSLTLSGFQAFVDAPTATVTVTGGTIINGDRAFVSARAGGNSFGPVTISGSQPFFEHGGGTSGPVNVTGSGFWEAYGPVTVTGNPAFNVTGDASISTFGGANALITVNGDVILGGTDGRLVPGPTLGGWTINGNLQLTAAGRLVMNQNADTVRVNGNASFGGADETGSLTAGALFVSGSFSQTGVATSFASTGTAVTLNGSGAQTVSLASPGFAASRFSTLLIENSAGQVQLASDVHVSSLFGRSGTNPAALSGNGGTLFLTNLILYNWTFTNVLVNITRTTGFSAIPALSNVTFSGYAPTATPLTINDPGITPSVQFSGVTFGVTPTTGFYLDATDTGPTDGVPLAIDMINPSPAFSGGRVQLAGGATTTWPAVSPGGPTWVGTTNDWNTASNWSTGSVPTNADDVTIPAGTPFAPTVTASCSVRTLTVNTGAALNLNGINCQVLGDVTADGSINGPGALNLSGLGSIRGNVPSLIINNVSVTAVAPLTVTGNVTVTGSAANFDVGGTTVTVTGNFTTQAGALMQMDDPGSLLEVQGNFIAGGGDLTGRLTAGRLRVVGNFTQSATTSPVSFVATGTHVTEFSTAVTRVVTFATPGAAASRFNDLEVTTALGGNTFNSSVHAARLISRPAGAAPTLGAGALGLSLTTAGADVSGLRMDAMQLVLGNGPIAQFDNVQFQNFASTVNRLVVQNQGATLLTFNNLVFTSAPSSGFFYLIADDTDAGASGVLTINMVNATPASPSSFVQTINNAVVNWPPASPAVTWTGAVDTDWNNPGNWSPAQVPTINDDVLIPAGTPNDPVAGTIFTRNLTVAVGATLTASDHTFNVAGNLDASGQIGGPGGCCNVNMTGVGVTARGWFFGFNLDIAAGAVVTLNGPVTMSGGESVNIAGELILGGQTLTAAAGSVATTFNTGLLTMSDPADMVVAGAMFFSGGDQTGRLIDGEIQTPSFNQGGVATSFVAGGNHRVTLNSTLGSQILFADPVNSRFQDLDVTGVSATLALNSDVTVARLFSSVTGGANGPTVTGGGSFRTLTVGGTDVNASSGSTALTFNGVRVVISGGTIFNFSDAVFTGQDPAVTQLTVNDAGQAAPFVFDNLDFQTPPGSGLYLLVNDLDGPTPDAFQVSLTNAQPASPGSLTQVSNGAVLLWNGVAPAVQWTGAVSTNWDDPGNWGGGAVPTATDDVTIPSGGNQPVLSAAAFARNLTVQPSAALDLAGFVLVLTGGVNNAGTVTATPGAGGLSLGGTGTVAGVFNALMLVSGPYSLGGRTRAVHLSVNGATADLNLNGQTLEVDSVFTTGAGGTLTMQQATDSLLAQDVAFQGGSTAGRLTAGTIALGGTSSGGGTLVQTAATSPQSFAASGTHKVLFAGFGGSIALLTPQQSRFQHLEVATGAGGVTIAGRADALGDVTLGTTTFDGDTLAVSGAITTAGGSIINITNLLVGGTITANGTYNVINTVFNGSNQGLPSGLAYQNVVVDASGGQPGFLPGNPSVDDFTILSSGGAEFFLGGTLTVRGNALFSGSSVIFDPAGFTMDVAGGLTIQNGARLLDGTSGTISIGGDLVADGGPQTTGMQFVTVTLGGNFTQGNSTTATSWVDPVTFNGSGVQSVNFTSPGSSQSRFGTLTVNKTGGTVLLQSDAFASAVNVVADTLQLGGHALTVSGPFATAGTGVLKMVQPVDALTVSGNAAFGGGNELGHMSDGVLAIGGNLTQLNNGTGNEFHPSGNHLTMLTGPNPTVTFATPGNTPGTSHFERVRWTGNGTLTLNSDVFAHDLFGTTAGANGTIRGSGQRALSVGVLDVDGATFDQVSLGVTEAALSAQNLKNVTFTNYPTTSALVLTLNLFGGAAGPRSLTFDNIDFAQSLAIGANNFYVRATQLSGAGLTVTIPNSNQGITGTAIGPALSDPANQQTINGVTILWP